MDSVLEKFLEDARELLDSLEKCLLALEQNPQDAALMEEAFRAMHTLKGAGAMFGFTHISTLTHDLETVYEFIRSGRTAFTPGVQTVTWQTIDLIRVLLAQGDALQDAAAEATYTRLIETIRQLSNQLEDEHAVVMQAASAAGGIMPARATYYLSFLPKDDMLKTGVSPLYLLDDLYTLGTCQVYPHLQVPALEALDEHRCYVSWSIFVVTDKGRSAIEEIFMFAEDRCTLTIQQLEDGDLTTSDTFRKLLTATGKRDRVFQPEELQKSWKNSGHAPASTQARKKLAAAKDNTFSSIRVDVNKLDEMINIVSELITLQARLALLSENETSPALLSVTEGFDKRLRQLRDASLSMSLIPVETLYTRFQRLVRDLSKELQKDIAFVAEGGETALDKSIIEHLSEPMLHLLRNSIDHGIEDADTRVRAGKTAQGTIRLRSFYSAGNVVVTIQDDGKGIDKTVVRRKAIEKGLVSPEAVLSDKEVLNLIFLPGFSTADKITEVSGRGVGMDVVRQKIEALRGEIEIESDVNVGTTMTLRLPLTLSIIDGLLVRAGETCFVLPVALVHKCYEVPHAQVLTAHRDMLVIEGEQTPFIYLRSEFSLPGEAPALLQAIVVHYETHKVALVVDAIVGEYQAVLKPIEHFYKMNDLLFGATILGDGSIALALDANRLIKQFSNSVRQRTYATIL
jgi:two-component system, chemotaxis family, sensor kinase CheA